ncbi:hypothetical protein B0H21DRAFT_37133 [Amylocystis lapponica]|nr:hypothetical protein B0H21DRAFT_37133 [Amylocystis lapponica]
MEWLAEMVRSGAIPPITGYVVADDSTEVPLLNPLPTSEIDAVTAVNKYPEMPEVHNEPEVPNLVNVPEVFKADYKGKGKERATEHTLTDVTNGESHAQSSNQGFNDVSDSPANAPLLLEHADYPLPSPPPNIDFEPTHGSLAVEQEDDEPFGQPSGLLGTAPSLALSYATPPPLSRRATTDEPNPVLSPGGAPDELGIRPSSAKPSSIDLPSQCERVPSSESPSPLKLLPHIDGHETPEKIRPAPSRELRKSFTTLLGKRPSSEDDGPDPARTEQSRMSKRARPPSKQNLVFEKDAAPAKPNASHSPPGAYAGFAPADGDTSFLDAELAERSMLVTYADPGQLDEKQQLMQLLVDQKREIWDVDSELPVPAAVARPGAKGPNKGRAAVGRRGTRVAGV